MPGSIRALTTLLPVALLLHCTGTPEQPQPEPSARGDAVRGGALYDKWWVVSEGAEAPTGNHPLRATRPDATSNPRTGSTTWRCKERHG